MTLIFPYYLIIDLFVLLGPVFISIVGPVKFLRKYKAFIPAIITVAVPYIIWDMLVTGKDWYFNPKYVLPIRIIDLPLEEIMFFFVVPFAILFVYEYVITYIPVKKFKLKKARIFEFILLIIFLIITVFALKYQYLTLALISLIIYILIDLFSGSYNFSDRNYWIYMGFGVISFIIVNYLLTSIPVVEYYTKTILTTSYWDGRITTIPLEDFIYNFSLLSLYLFFYRKYSAFQKKDH
ncbi:lycopene cyclase domain-containing protein [Cuniculiplasma divulgatum]|jgi:lycopene cyclase domain-containing protein|uniref:Lycopene cyclase n=1 Tax=Cuniculiplasma divulgatum TaxID=1673428 RepID=A0A1R4A791_9ARCH|nr:lycopene cyclase domain-containing protein [Cuniculiplasma divulgatum]MCI2411909.1 lycopene cyclase domain-containing protein [Cuniculiplasma sp.]WMT49097.1 MAG: lycopene cyclase domain-containing protein [Thermoplasmatales archaeon]SJK84816.1 lycopene cyclase [Cuniculiplasma divulgatum]